MSSKWGQLAGAVLVFLTSCSVNEGVGCTVFYAADGDTVLGGNNEDWHVPLTKIWFVPREEDKFGVVYDLKRKVVYLYHFHDFDNVVVFDLEKELAKGERVIEMPSLFPAKPAFERFRRKSATDRQRRSRDDNVQRD